MPKLKSCYASGEPPLRGYWSTLVPLSKKHETYSKTTTPEYS
jgi:hypothetical protein